jgi:hypothetical protein
MFAERAQGFQETDPLPTLECQRTASVLFLAAGSSDGGDIGDARNPRSSTAPHR